MVQNIETIIENTKQILNVMGYRNINNLNHNRIGIIYILITYKFGFSGILYSILIRLEIDSCTIRLIQLENINIYNMIITIHALLMIFLLVMPSLFSGLGNILLPTINGNSDVIYIRMNNLSLLKLGITYGILLISLTTEFTIGIGWTLYPPLSTSLMSLSTYGINIIIYSLLILGISSSLTSLNYIITINNMKSIGIYVLIISLYIWSLIITSSLLLLVLPILSSILAMLITDLHYNTIFYDPYFGGDPIFYQHIFWFFAHPEVYILVLPAFGIISLIIICILNTNIFGNQSMILAMTCISLLGTIVWAHHMLTIGMECDSRSNFTSNTLIIALPTSIKIFNWLCTYLNSNKCIILISYNIIFYIKCFLIMFTLGGTTGIILGNSSIDICLHDTYYIICHFHLILSLGTIIGLIIGIIYSIPYLMHCHSINSIK